MYLHVAYLEKPTQIYKTTWMNQEMLQGYWIQYLCTNIISISLEKEQSENANKMSLRIVQNFKDLEINVQKSSEDI